MTYDPIRHVEGRPAGMLGRMSTAVNNQNDGHLRARLTARKPVPSTFGPPAFEGMPLSVESSRAIIHFRLHPFEAVCDLSTGESRVNQDH